MSALNYFSRKLFAKHQTFFPSVGFTVAGLDRAKLAVYQFQSFLFIVVIVKSLLERLKNISMASEKLYRNTLKLRDLSQSETEKLNGDNNFFPITLVISIPSNNF